MDIFFVIYSLGGPKQLSGLLFSCLRLPSKLSSKIFTKVFKMLHRMVRSLSQNWICELFFEMDQVVKAVNLQSVRSGHYLRQQKNTEALNPPFCLSLFAAWNFFFLYAENVPTLPGFPFAFTVCIDIFLTLCSLCILFSICHAIKPMLDSAVKCSRALIRETKELEYKRHFMKVLKVAICDSLCLMVPYIQF